jgi:hypothetical protein
MLQHPGWDGRWAQGRTYVHMESKYKEVLKRTLRPGMRCACNVYMQRYHGHTHMWAGCIVDVSLKVNGYLVDSIIRMVRY